MGYGQTGDEKAILSNQYGSQRYASFLSGLGQLVSTASVDPGVVFLQHFTEIFLNRKKYFQDLISVMIAARSEAHGPLLLP